MSGAAYAEGLKSVKHEANDGAGGEGARADACGFFPVSAASRAASVALACVCATSRTPPPVRFGLVSFVSRKLRSRRAHFA